MEMRKILAYLAIKYNGDFDGILKALREKEKVKENEVEKALAELESDYVTVIDDDYPNELKKINCPPFVLFYYGNIGLCNSMNCIAVTGSKNYTEYGEKVTMDMARELVDNNYYIVTGLRKGIESLAYRTACAEYGKTISVLPCGIDYNDENRMLKNNVNQLILSEYPNDFNESDLNFIKRNRIIAGLSQKVLVTETEGKDIIMTLVGYALEQGKDIFAVPNSINGMRGCNELIREGAYVTMSVADIQCR